MVRQLRSKLPQGTNTFSKMNTSTASTTTKTFHRSFKFKHTSARKKITQIEPVRPQRERNISTTKQRREGTSTSTHPKDSNLLNAPKIRGRDDDSLSRFPNLSSPGGILRGLDYGGTITFALSGSITAAQSGLDVFGCSIVAMITAVGGGTIRDAVFLARRPFWTSETEYIWMTVLTGFVTFFTWPMVMLWNEDRKKEKKLECGDINSNDDVDDRDHCQKKSDYDEFDAVLDTFDAIGLSAFAIIGAQNGVRAGMPIVVSAICGISTSTFGGVLRDVVCGRPIRIVHSNAEVYAETALAGAITYLGAMGMRLSPGLRIGSAMFVCLGSRYIAVKHDIKLYTWETENDKDGLGVAVRK